MTILVIPGQPVPCGRPRMTVGGHAYMPERTRRYESLVRRLSKGVFQVPMECDVDVSILFCLPDRRRRDLDNLAKGVMDGMNGVAFRDDSQVCSLSVCKMYRKGAGFAVVEVVPSGGVDAWFFLWGLVCHDGLSA